MLRLSIITLILLAGTAHGQGFGGFNGGFPEPLPPPPGVNPFNPQPMNSAEVRKDARDQILRSIGPEALPFTKKYGDLGITALQQCDIDTGKRIVALFNSGAMSRLKNPQAVLEAIRQYGSPAGVWFCQHHQKLADPEALECWCKAPLEYAYDLKDIDQSAEELRASRKLLPSWLSTSGIEWNLPTIIVVALVGLVVIGMFLKRRNPGPAIP